MVDRSLARRPGAAYLTQGAGDLSGEHADAPRCPGDPSWPGRPRGSYRGPDEWLLKNENRLIAAHEEVILACDWNGPDGDEPQHVGGVVVLDSNFQVGFVPWEKMEGYDPVLGDPVKVGPGSPDPRFRHLVP